MYGVHAMLIGILVTLIIILLPLAGMSIVVMILCHRNSRTKQIILDAIHQGLRTL